MTKVAPITHRELIRPRARFLEKVLTPRETPIYPSVYDSQPCFTPEYIERIKSGMPETIRRDLETVRELLPERFHPRVEVGPDYIESGGHRIPFSEIEHTVDPQDMRLSVTVYASHITIDRGTLPRELDVTDPALVGDEHAHPMGMERLRQFAFGQYEDGEPRIHTWYQHNVFDMGEGFFFYMRNFAILFNNLAME